MEFRPFSRMQPTPAHEILTSTHAASITVDLNLFDVKGPKLIHNKPRPVFNPLLPQTSPSIPHFSGDPWRSLDPRWRAAALTGQSAKSVRIIYFAQIVSRQLILFDMFTFSVPFSPITVLTLRTQYQTSFKSEQ